MRHAVAVLILVLLVPVAVGQTEEIRVESVEDDAGVHDCGQDAVDCLQEADRSYAVADGIDGLEVLMDVPDDEVDQIEVSARLRTESGEDAQLMVDETGEGEYVDIASTDSMDDTWIRGDATDVIEPRDEKYAVKVFTLDEQAVYVDTIIAEITYDEPLKHVSTPYANDEMDSYTTATGNDAVVRMELENTATEPVTMDGIRFEDTSHSDVARVSLHDSYDDSDTEVRVKVDGSTEGYISTNGWQADSLMFTGVADGDDEINLPDDYVYPFDEDEYANDWTRTSDVPVLDPGDVATVKLGEFREYDHDSEAERDMTDESVDFTLFYADDLDQTFSIDVYEEGEDSDAWVDADIRHADSPVDAGETVDVVVDVTNTGWEKDTRDISLAVDGTTRDGTGVELHGQDSTRVTLEWDTERTDGGEYDVTVATGDTTETTTVDVTPWDAELDPEITVGSTEVFEEETVTVDGSVTCSGEDDCTDVELELVFDDDSLFDPVGDETYDCGTLSGGETCSETWEVTAAEAGSTDIGVTASTPADYIEDATETVSVSVTDPDADMMVDIEPETTDLLEGTSFAVEGTVTCVGEDDCPHVDMVLSYDTGVFDLAGGDTYDCGTVHSDDTCSAGWELMAADPGTHDLTVSAVSTEEYIEDAETSAEITVKAPDVTLETITPGGESAAFQAVTEHTANVGAAVTCSLNDEQFCDATVHPTDETDAVTCAGEPTYYEADNTVECTAANETYGIKETISDSFTVDADITDARVDMEEAYQSQSITVSCDIVNDAPFALSSGDATHSHVRMSSNLSGPDDSAVERHVEGLSVDAASTGTVNVTRTVPDDAMIGQWQAGCTDLELIDAMMLADETVSTGFEVLQRDIEEVDVTVLEPADDTEVYTGEPFRISAQVTDEYDNPVTGAGVRVQDASIPEEDEGLYRGDHRLAEGEDHVEIKANAGGLSDAVTVPMNPIPGLDLAVDEVDGSMPGDTIDVTGSVAAYREPEAVQMQAVFEGPDGWEDERDAVVQDLVEDDEETFTVSYDLPPDAPVGDWHVDVIMEERYESDTMTRHFDVSSPESGEFDIHIVSPDRDSFTVGDTFELMVQPVDTGRERAIDVDAVDCTFAGDTIDLSQDGGLYSGSVTVSEDLLQDTYTLQCHGERMVDGEQFQSSETREIDVFEEELRIEILNAEELARGEENTLRVDVLEGNRTVENATVDIEMDGETREIDVTRQEDGTYAGSAYIPDETEEIQVRASSAEGNVGEVQVVMDEPGGVHPGIVAIIVIVLLGMMIGMYYRFQLASVEERIESLERQKRAIEQSMKDAERKYYNRKLDKDTYMDMMEKYEQKKTLMKNQLNELRDRQDDDADSNGSGTAG